MKKRSNIIEQLKLVNKQTRVVACDVQSAKHILNIFVCMSVCDVGRGMDQRQAAGSEGWM